VRNAGPIADSESRSCFAARDDSANKDINGKGKAIVIDADASTYLMNVDPRHWQGSWETNLMSAPAALANVLRPHGDYAIIGPGGGVDVLRAVGNGSPMIWRRSNT
jgi:hypothetical protein